MSWFYEAAAHPEAWAALLADVASCTKAIAPRVMLVDRATNARLLEIAPTVDPTWDRAYTDNFPQRDLRRRES